MAETSLGLNGLGAPPTGLAADAFSGFSPVRTAVPADVRTASLPQARSQSVGRPAAWRSASPLERSMIQAGSADLFPHTRGTVPLLVPDALEDSMQLSLPLRAMNGPTVGVRWKIPGYTP